MPEPTIPVRVGRIAREADGINSYELVDPAGGALPEFAAGAHIDVHLPGLEVAAPSPPSPAGGGGGGWGAGPAVRQYSLCNDPAERHRYLIAVLVEDRPGGFSRRLHEEVGAGAGLEVSAPRNRFPLIEGAAHYLLLAGGIGVTPLLSMSARLATIGADFTLHYCTRSPDHTPFRGRLDGLARAGRVVYHHDGGDPKQGLDIGGLLASRRPGTQLYYCGPLGFMRAVRESSAHWPRDALHCEYFMPEAEPDAGQGRDRFRIMIAATGAICEVTPGESILDALRRQGLASVTACAAADCGLCRMRFVGGEPVHRDRLLTDSERGEFVIACKARSRSPLLVLDP
jgi:ferredoxin-NADP reductase